jgi:hypothetical protein
MLPEMLPTAMPLPLLLLDDSLKGIAARVALPEVPHAAVIDVFRPFWHEQAFVALRAWNVRA